ncbi:MAG: hypothetical protein RBJ76_13070 [Stenomitos frigidus ULC029]
MARKTILTQQDIDQIQTMAGLGLTLDKIALVLSVQGRNVSKSTLETWKRENSDVQQAFQRGIALAELKIAKTLYEIATVDRNLGALIWYEKSRFGRREVSRQEVHHSADQDSAPQVVVYMPNNGRDTVNATETS